MTKMVRVLPVVLPEPRVAGWSVLLQFFYAQPSSSSFVMREIFAQPVSINETQATYETKHSQKHQISTFHKQRFERIFMGPTTIKIAVYALPNSHVNGLTVNQ